MRVNRGHRSTNPEFPKLHLYGHSAVFFRHGEVPPHFKGYFGLQEPVVSPPAFCLPAKLVSRYLLIHADITDLPSLRSLDTRLSPPVLCIPRRSVKLIPVLHPVMRTRESPPCFGVAAILLPYLHNIRERTVKPH